MVAFFLLPKSCVYPLIFLHLAALTNNIMIELNRIYCESNLDTMSKMPDGFIDLTVTSPPYDNLRTYNGYSFPFEEIAKELFRVTKQGGVVVWVVGDATVKGSESGTSFKQALFFMQCGFNLHDTMIWNKPNSMPNVIKTRYRSSFEYMFVFSKGKPKTSNMIQENCKYGGQVIKRTSTNKESIDKAVRNSATNDTKIKSNVWDIIVAGTNYGHPAIFPEQLAEDHIISWSNEGEIVYDPFTGSGTTPKMAKKLNRKWIGSEISVDYVAIANERLSGNSIVADSKTQMVSEPIKKAKPQQIDLFSTLSLSA